MKFSVSDLLDQLRGESVLPVEDLEKKLALRSAVDNDNHEVPSFHCEMVA